jgi:hypothetical protein
MTRMAAAWRKAGFSLENCRFADATGEWERERADAEDLFGRPIDARLPRESCDTRESRGLAESIQPRVEAHRHPHRAPGDPPTLHDELAGLVWRVFIAPATPVRSVMFCGADGEQSSDEVAAVAAELLAGHDAGTVCLVNSTGAVPTLDRQFAAPPAGFAGMSADVKSTHTEQQVLENLWLVPPASPAIGGDDRAITNEQLCELREQFDYVIVAAPAVLAGSEAMAIAAVVDGVILLIAENTTRRDTARTAIEGLQRSDGRILGAVLTNRSYPIPPAIYRRL